MQMHSHLAYGLCIRSELELGAPSPAAPRADVSIYFAQLAPRAQSLAEQVQIQVTPDQVDLAWREIGCFRVRGGTEIAIDPAPSATREVLRTFLLGPILAVVLHQRGYLVLHGGSVAINGKAVAFLADKGQGKSTLLGALHRRGHRVLADDISAVVPLSGTHHLLPGAALLKLWPDALSALGSSCRGLPRIHPKAEKRLQPLKHFSTAPAPLERIYFLADGPRVAFEALPPQEALIGLIRHAYTWKLLNGADRAAHLKLCGALANQIPIHRLRRPWALPEVPSIVRRLEVSCG